MSLRALARRAEVDSGHLWRVVNRPEAKPATGELAGRLAVALELPRDYFPEFREAAIKRQIAEDGDLRDAIYDELPDS